MNQKSSIGVVGLSHLGVVSSIGFASLGFRVYGSDTNSAVVRQLQDGKCLVSEPGLQEIFSKHRDQIFFSEDFSKFEECDVVFIARDTPTDEEKSDADLAPVHALIDACAAHLKDGVEIVLASQVPVGFTRALRQRMQRLRSDISFSLQYFVETLVIGDAVQRFLKPERLIFGLEDVSTGPGACLQSVIAQFSCPVFFMKLESAELTKAAINLYLAATITYANTLANICEATGADIAEILPALRLDRRIGPYAYIKPGLGLSGGHLERDLAMLSKLTRASKARAKLLDTIRDESEHRYAWLQAKLESEVFAHIPNPKIALWGISYKKNTDSTFRAPSLRVIQEFGMRATIIAHDPVAKLPSGSTAERASDKYEALKNADCLLILCDWDEFAKPDFAQLKKNMKTPLIIDGLGVLYGVEIPEGITYVAMGRS